VRTVVFRGFRSGSDDLLLITDQRSDKLAELAQQPRAELCAYLPDTRDQFRFNGRMQIHTATGDSTGLRSDLWSRLSEAARQQFTWPEPGAAQSPESAFHALAPAAPPDCFTVLTLVPERVDHLQLRPSPQQRQRHQLRDGVWETCDINP
jgi:PPOX class probable FMN-dependent enzyme